MSDPRKVAHAKKVAQEKKHEGMYLTEEDSPAVHRLGAEQAARQLDLPGVIRLVLRYPDNQLTDRPSLSAGKRNPVPAGRYFRDGCRELRVLRLDQGNILGPGLVVRSVRHSRPVRW